MEVTLLNKNADNFFIGCMNVKNLGEPPMARGRTEIYWYCFHLHATPRITSLHYALLKYISYSTAEYIQSPLCDRCQFHYFQPREAKRIASENDGVSTFLDWMLALKRVTCRNEKLC